MSLRSWSRNLFTRPASRTIRKAPRRARLSMEALEDRMVPSTFKVLNTNDSGAGSLRDAITQAQSGANLGVADTIVFNNNPLLGTNFYDSTPDIITLTSGQLTLTDTKTTTISGPGADLLSISGGGLSRVFGIDSGASAAISGLTITGGKADLGGGVFNSGTLTLTDCTASGNSATVGSSVCGGGMFNSGTATLTNCTVSGNTALSLRDGSGKGGGVFNCGTVTLTTCTLSGNLASVNTFYSSLGGSGGGLFNSGAATLTDSTVSRNTCQGGSVSGGGLTNDGTATLTDCTIFGNYVGGFYTGFGGGLNNNGLATLTHCTVSGNSADSNNAAGEGAGVFNSGMATLTNCTVNNNGAGSAYTDSFGGGVFNSGTATLTDCTVSGNVASGNSFIGYGKGGGVFNSGTTTLTDCTLSGNSSGGFSGNGGGVFNSGTATLTDCTVSGNAANSYNAGSSGGGVFNSGTATLTNCTVSGNSATGNGGFSYFGGGGSGSGSGGGVFNSGTATLTNCTVSGNAATGNGGFSYFGGGGSGSGSGGGVFNSGTATLTNCTVSGNAATGNGGFNDFGVQGSGSGSGGGITGSGFTVANTIIAGNTATFSGNTGTVSAPDGSGAVTSLGHNLIGITDGSTGWVGSDLTNASASPLNLGPLADNGGPTQTMALLPGSRAINAGSNALAVDANGVALAFDQRGPGYPRIHGDTVDIGAFEVNIASQTITFGPLADQTYGVAPITLGATASSGLPVSYQVISGPATLSGNVLTITGAGTVVVQATQAGDASYASADPVTQSFTVAKATLTGDATTQDALNMAKLGKLTITVSNVSGLVNGDKLADFLKTASYYITIGTTKYEFDPTTVTTSGSSITITYSMKDPTLLAELGHALDAATSGATAVTAGFDMESANYSFFDPYLTRLFSTVK